MQPAKHSSPGLTDARAERRTLIASVFLGIVGPQGVLMMPLIVGNLADRLALSPAQAGFEASAALSGACVAGAVLTWLVRAVAWRYLGLALVSALCAGYAVLTTHPGHVESLLAMFTVGLGMGGSLALAMTASADSEGQVRSTGLIFGLQGALGAALAAVAPSIAAVAGERGLFVLLFAVSAVAFVALPMLPATPRRARATSVPSGPSRVPWPALGAALIAWGAINFASGGFWPFMERIAVADGQTPAAAGHGIGLALLVGIFGGLSAAMIGNRLGRLAPLVFVGVATVGSLGALILHPGASAFAGALCVFVFVWNFGPAYQLQVVVSADFTGRSMPLALLTMKIFMAIAPACFGLLAGPGGYERAGVLAIGAAVLSTVVFIAIEGRRRGAAARD